MIFTIVAQSTVCESTVNEYGLNWTGWAFRALFTTLHRGAFCQFPFRWIDYCHSSKSIGKEIGITHLCALGYIIYLSLWNCFSSEECILFNFGGIYFFENWDKLCITQCVETNFSLLGYLLFPYILLCSATLTLFFTIIPV